MLNMILFLKNIIHVMNYYSLLIKIIKGMMAKNILSNLIKALCYCFRSIFELLKRSITLRNE